MDAADVIRSLELRPHPEGGWFSETWRDPGPAGRRAASTALYYLLRAGERSHWHRVDASETWHFYLGNPLLLELAATGHGPVERHTLGADLALGGVWQAARPLGSWALVGCTVAPGFLFDGFELAPPGWRPGSHD